MAKLMRAARMHAVGDKMVIEDVERPTAAGTDVVVAVKGCGMVPNLANVLANWETLVPPDAASAAPGDLRARSRSASCTRSASSSSTSSRATGST